jgi:AraC family transcriptional regulator, transcriptional activator FtrA
MHTVVAVLVDGVAAFELGVACEVFGLSRPELNVPWYDFLVCAAEPPPLRSTGGMLIDTPHGLSALAAADTLVFPSWRSPAERPPEALLEAVRRADARGARLVSICSGVFILAAAGVLDGRPATTHWRYTDALVAQYPSIKVTPDVLYVDDGRVLTSAGTAAAIDLCLHIVRRDYGAQVANAVARRMVVPPHREGGQAQYVDRPVSPVAEADALGPALVWAMKNLHRPQSVPDLARRAAMSPRTFARRFRAEHGTTPHRWLLHQRLLLARRWLESGAESVEDVAEHSGFGSAAALRMHFRRTFGTSPQAYRRQFGPGPAPPSS